MCFLHVFFLLIVYKLLGCTTKCSDYTLRFYLHVIVEYNLNCRILILLCFQSVAADVYAVTYLPFYPLLKLIIVLYRHIVIYFNFIFYNS